MKTEFRCGCKVCHDHREYEEILTRLSFDSLPEEVKHLINGLYDSIRYLQDDINYLESIIDGSWPSADECIKASREKDRTQEAEEYNKKYPRWEAKINGVWVAAKQNDSGEWEPL